MTESTVAIVGSGIVGTTMAYHLANQGFTAEIFEKGPEYPYPHGRQFREKIHYMYDLGRGVSVCLAENSNGGYGM
jgi:2-polyprenyl-6-methoxyphenol hydroxylase-like FAD-dependent oxidoreductase